MSAQVLSVTSERDYAQAITRASAAMNAGGLVVFPTETVYGVGARADLPEAAERLRRLKSRTDGKPFTVHIPHRDAVWAYVAEVHGPARRLVQKGWPGPITLLFEVPDPTSAAVLRGGNGRLAAELYHEGQVGLRCPDHPIASRLLSAVEGPVVAASANLAGREPPQTAQDAVAELGSGVDLVLDGGKAQFSVASTIVRLSGRNYEIVREGVYDARTVRRLACMNLLFVCTGNTCRSPMAAGICEKLLSEDLGCSVQDLPRRDVVVRSAGTFAMSGGRVSAEAVEVLRRRGIDVSGRTSASLTAELIHQSDRIYAMTQGHLESVVAMVPVAADKVALLGETEEIDDPVGRSVDVYEACAARIERALRRRLEELKP